MAAGNERWSRFWVASKASTNQLKYIEIYWNLLWPSEIMWNRFPPLNSLWTFTHLTPVPGSCWDFAAGSSRWWSLTRKMKRSTFQRGWYLAKRWGLEAVSHRSSTTGGFFGFLGPKHIWQKKYALTKSTGSTGLPEAKTTTGASLIYTLYRLYTLSGERFIVQPDSAESQTSSRFKKAKS